MRKMLAGLVLAIAFACPLVVYAAEQSSLVILRSEAGGVLARAFPPEGSEKDSLLILRLSGEPWEIGYQHGLLLADNIAEVIHNRYSCDAFTPEVLAWINAAFNKMPHEFQEEILGMTSGLSSKGYNLPFEKVVMHATQPLMAVGVSFPWFVCPWNEGSGPTGSFSYAVWGRYTPTGTALSINSPDWGPVPKSLARNRVLVSVRRGYAFRYAYLGVAGVIGMPGVNETGLSIAGTAGLPSMTAVTPMFGNGVPTPDGFMTPFMTGAHVLRNFSGTDPEVYNRFEEVLRINPPDGFILQIATPTTSALWESGAAASPEYPYNSRRMAGEWDAGNITPVDWRGDFVLTAQGEILLISALPFPVFTDFHDSSGDSYSGRAWINGAEVRWQRMQLGRAFALPSDAGRGARFANWFANLGVKPVAVPFAVSENSNGGNLHIVSVRPDKTGGWWVLADGSGYGSWTRDGDSSFRAFGSDGVQACAGPLYDFGNGVTGWCSLDASTDIEWVALIHQYPAGADERLDGMNLSILPQTKPWSVTGFPLFGGPHSRTHFILRELGAPQGTLTLDEFYKTFQRAYFSVGAEDAPFGVGAYDLASGDAIFTVSRYEGDLYIGGLNPKQKPIALNRYQLFGW